MDTTVNQNDEIYKEVRKAYNIIGEVDWVILKRLIKKSKLKRIL